jgi:taurine dioxygenase
MYQTMPVPMQEMLKGLEVEHDLLYNSARLGGLQDPEIFGRIESLSRRAIHPAVITHPRTGRELLFVNVLQCRSFVGVQESINRDLMNLIHNIIQLPDLQVRLRWAPDTVAMWDNWSTMHYATFDYGSCSRHMQRLLVKATCEPSRIAS